MITANEGWNLEYTPPTGMRIKEILFASYGTSENYQYGWCHAESSQFIVENYLIGNTSLIIGANNSVFGDPCGGTYKHLSVVLTIEPDPNYVEPTPTPTETPTVEPTPTPTEQTPTPTPTEQPTVEPSPTPTPSASESETVKPRPTQPSVPEQESGLPEPASTPTETPTQTPQENNPSNNNTTEMTINDILESLSPGEAVSAEMIAESGIDYSQLPPQTPVELPNGVILTAEVADALQIFENPAEMLLVSITDPAKALKALASIGADMTPEKRDQSQKVVVAAVIAGQLMNALSAANMIGRKL
jgi:hypothetical protein